NVGVSGMTAMAKRVMEETMAELVYYIVFAVVVVMIILLIATSSYFEPIILMTTLLVSVLVNMGTNIIYPSVSIISFAAVSVLQLGIAMDYAIFFMHTFKEQRKDFDFIEATKKTIPKVITTIMASSLTTMCGFAALAFMNFKLGFDLAQVVVKGIFLSFLTVIFLQPALVILFDKVLKKTSHKDIEVNFEKVSSFTIKWRKLFVIAAAALIVPAFIMQSNVGFSYLKIYNEPEDITPQQQRAFELGNQVIAAVPLETKQGEHKEYIDELLSDEKIGNVIGAYSAMDISRQNLEIILNLTNGSFESGGMGAVSALFKKVDGEWYTLYLIEILGDTENQKALETHSHLVATTDKYFDKSYPLGILTGTFDLAAVTPSDFLKVTIISSLIILLLLSILLKSFRKSLIMVLIIELAIWLNISLNFLFSSNINFMVYIIIGSVQLGCTVDYAILLSTRFEEAKRQFPDVKTAAIKASSSAFPAITTSASIIIATCLSIVFVTDNLLVREMAFVLARGAFISYALVVTILPGLLVYFKKIRPIKEEMKKIISEIKK
ncbi:MAG: MMPL family transporter, partial [Bacillota bacterium]